MINLRDVGIRFENEWVFRHLNLDVPASERIALTGPSGSGKSVLLKIMAGLLAPQEGEVLVQSQNVSMLFQKNALFDSLTALENLLLPLREYRKITGSEALARARHFLKEVGLEQCESLYPDEISGGMQKRLGIARALIIEPEILLYDEPTAGLDPITSRRIADLILKLQSETKGTLVVVTNDLMRALQLGERLYLMARGQLIPGGSPDEFRHSASPAIRQFAEGRLEGPLTDGEGDAP